MGTMRLVVDARDQGMPTEVSVDRLSELLADQKRQLWLDISDPGPAEVALLHRKFGFHELALEDVTKPHERPRCDAYEGYYFIVVYAAEHAGDTFLPQELNLFWGENYLVTNSSEAGCRAGGAGRGAETLGAKREAAKLRGGRSGVHALREPGRRLFRGAGSGAEANRGDRGGDLQGGRGRGSRPIPASEGAAPGPPANTSVFYAFNRLGKIMQRLTAITLIILVPNFVASVYGMNFDRTYPPGDWEYGFLAVVAFLACMITWGFIHSRLLRWL